MPDIAITPSAPQNYNVTGKIVPSYLITLESGKKETYFIASRFDDSFTHCGKFVGFFTTDPLDHILVNYETIIKETHSSNYMEVMFPWAKIHSIRNLIYKHKTK